MKPVMQTIFAPPKGNCYQACIASLLELPLDGVPNFADGPRSRFWDRVDDWLESQGLQVLHINELNGFEIKGYHIISGKSPRGNWRHATVGFQGEIVHDPHPEGGGLKEIEAYEVFLRIFK